MAARKSFPIGIVLMILIMVLAVLGVGYAWWSDQLEASGSVMTGNINVRMEDVTIGEEDPLEAATCVYQLAADGKTITISIDNGYPLYTCALHMKLNNYGTVPAKVSSLRLPQGDQNVGIDPNQNLGNQGILQPASPVEANFVIRVRPEASENITASFDFVLEVTQGNAP